MRIILFLYIFIYPLVGISQGDTLNRVDAEGKKYGYWIISGKDKKHYGYAEFSIYEEGFYVEGRKEGKWIQYYPNQNLKHELEYKNNRPNGKFKIYFESGELEEKGKWARNFYIDTFYRYYPGMKLAQLRIFNAYGKSHGWQTFFNENGEILLRFYANNGNEVVDSGIVGINSKQYEENPKWKINPTLSNEELCFCDIEKLKYAYIHLNENSDSVVVYSTSIYTVNLVGKFKSSKLYDGNCYVEIESEELKYFNYFVEKGKFKNHNVKTDELPQGMKQIKSYNQNKQIEYDGVFLEGKLYSGKHYFYDINGLLKKIEIYKEGKYVGDAQID